MAIHSSWSGFGWVGVVVWAEAVGSNEEDGETPMVVSARILAGFGLEPSTKPNKVHVQ